MLLPVDSAAGFVEWNAGIFFAHNFVKPCVVMRVSKLRDAPLYSSQPEKK